jgi:hypothetical protein
MRHKERTGNKMFHFSGKLFTLIIIFSCLFFYLVSCGGNTAVPVAEKPSFENFNNFISKCQNMPVETFIEYWNTEENKNYKFYFYRQLDPNSPIIWPDNDDGSQVYESKILNCFRINVLLLPIFPGSVKVLIEQPSVAYDHYYLKLQNGDIINNTNDGKLMTLKYIPCSANYNLVIHKEN